MRTQLYGTTPTLTHHWFGALVENFQIQNKSKGTVSIFHLSKFFNKIYRYGTYQHSLVSVRELPVPQEADPLVRIVTIAADSEPAK